MRNSEWDPRPNNASFCTHVPPPPSPHASSQKTATNMASKYQNKKEAKAKRREQREREQQADDEEGAKQLSQMRRRHACVQAPGSITCSAYHADGSSPARHTQIWMWVCSGSARLEASSGVHMVYMLLFLLFLRTC